jgi:signal peptidase I
VFIWPKDRSKKFVKRVAAVGGQTIEIKGQLVTIDGQRVYDPHIVFASPLKGAYPPPDVGPLTVPPEHVYVLGDNRDRSYDSRFWGPVPLSDVRGKVVEVYFSRGDDGIRWNRAGIPID